MHCSEGDPTTPQFILLPSAEYSCCDICPDFVTNPAPSFLQRNPPPRSDMSHDTVGQLKASHLSENRGEVRHITDPVALNVLSWTNAVDQTQDMLAQLLAGILWRCGMPNAEGLGEGDEMVHMHGEMNYERGGGFGAPQALRPLTRQSQGKERPGCGCFYPRYHTR
jgi:hypothetical protein